VKVLLVDQEEEFGFTLAERLRLRGINVRYALSLDQAFIEIQSWIPEIVVLDVTQQEIVGMETIRRLKADFPDVKIVATAGLGKVREVQESQRLGASHCLMKPFQIEELLEVLNDSI
jgi:DNA-binding response OmpR family regulator